RDAAICALGMAVSGDPELERSAAAGLETLAAHQAPNGQLPKFVDVDGREADFWYLGCIDSTLWWLIAVEYLDRTGASPGLLRRLRRPVDRALDWLLAQEHQRLHLLQQNEASDWADIMPRSGFVLYTAEPGSVPQLRQLLVLRGGGRRLRQPACDPCRGGGPQNVPPRARRAARGACA